MNQMKKLIIINNEKIFCQNNNYYCENIDIKSTAEGLDKDFDVLMIARKSKEKKFNEINLKKITIASSVLGFLINIFKTFGDKNIKYLLLSITPYTFFACLFLSMFNKKTFIYLRSN